jgi:hypothetical protein
MSGDGPLTPEERRRRLDEASRLYMNGMITPDEYHRQRDLYTRITRPSPWP